jgi:Fe(3+) dicitrate transport protein
LRNVTDEVYIVARRPYGVRPGLPRSLLVGLSAKF